MSDHTDPGHVTGAHERTTRSGPRVGDSGSPVGSPLTIVLALIAVAVGFLIFRSISDDGDALGGGLPGVTTAPGPTAAPGQTTVVGDTAPPGATTPTTGAPTREGATVVVINAGEVSQSAAAMTGELEGLGYTMADGIERQRRGRGSRPSSSTSAVPVAQRPSRGRWPTTSVG